MLPLGGLGEIGKNMAVVEYEGRIVVVDTGLMFPTPDQLGVDLVLPDFSYLRERAADIEAIVLTHGHEDHVGALPFVLREIGDVAIPDIYGGGADGRDGPVEARRAQAARHAAARGRARATRSSWGRSRWSRSSSPTRSPTCSASRSSASSGTTFFTGDYKFDQTPVDGEPADVARLAELGREGVLLLCGDSTNADRPGMAPSESSVGPHLEEVFTRIRGRIVITCFASNIHRVQQVVDAAQATGRKVALVGRSMRKYVNIGRQLGHIDVPEGMLVQLGEIDDFPDERLVIISTGSQGEPLSALRRMAHGDHPRVELHEHDTVIFSATPIPGNERAVNETIDRIYRLGADVITTSDAPIHASGHGNAEELKLMMNLTKPRYMLPVHGDYKRLRLHGQLAEQVGIEPDAIFRGRNGLPLEIDERGARWGEEEQAGMIFVDGVDIGDPEDVALRDRRMLSADGIFIVVATISEQDGRSVAEPEIIFRGVPFVEEEDSLVDEIRDAVEESLAKSAEEQVREISLLQSHLHDDVAGFVYKRLKRRPMVLPVVVEV